MTSRVEPAPPSTPIEPAFASFASPYEAGAGQVVWTKLPGDLETPVAALLKLTGAGAHSFMLESVEGGATRGRYSIIGLEPDLVFRAKGRTAEITRNPKARTPRFRPYPGKAKDPLAGVRALLAESAIPLPADLPPMAAGLFGYLGYDTVGLIEKLPEPGPDALGLPDMLLIRPTMMVVFDNVRDEITLITAVRPKPRQSAEQAYAAAGKRLNSALKRLDKALPRAAALPTKMARSKNTTITPQSNTTPQRYHAMVDEAKGLIAAGDIFQVVLSQRFSCPFSLPPFALYRSLRRVNPSPFMYYFHFGDHAVVGSSPEILVRLRGGEVTIRPIAGTRPRGATATEDAALATELLADPKERSEHLMLLDLGRNDVGRVARLGTVRPTETFTIERYSQVMHIVSNVVGEIADGCDQIDALMAGFPAGTVSGAPKVRAMEIIAELEAAKRGIYAGCVGYFSADGQMDTCIALRTAVLKDGTMHVQAGAGIVADSVPASEQQECINKAKALFRAAEDAHRFAAGAPLADAPAHDSPATKTRAARKP